MTTEGAKVLGIPLKWIALGMMVAQSVGIVALLRVVRTQVVVGPRFLITTAVFLAECLKFGASFLLHVYSSDGGAFSLIRQHFIDNPRELMKTSVPAFLFTLQTNLLFLAISYLPAATYQVTYQFKIPVTAVVSVALLGTKMTNVKWVALLLLTAGVALCSLTSSSAKAESVAVHSEEEEFMGLSAVAGACFTSALASVYLEKLLKESTASIWIRNMQLALFGGAIALALAFVKDGGKIHENGFFQGYNGLVWFVVVGQAFGGLIIAAVLKYADNIIKCFGTGIALVCTCLLSAYVLQEFTPDRNFMTGTFFVIIATALYSLGLPGAWPGQVLQGSTDEEKIALIPEGSKAV